MTKPAQKTEPAPDCASITSIAAPKHKWLRVPTYIHRDKTPSGCDETERECELCGLVKITVHQPEGFPYRAFRSKGGVRFNDPGFTPTCDGVVG